MGIYSGVPSMNPEDRGDHLPKAGTYERNRELRKEIEDMRERNRELKEEVGALRGRLKAISNQRAEFRDEIRPKPIPTARIAAQVLFFFGGLVTGLATFVLWWPS